jgi:hypothetical protein
MTDHNARQAGLTADQIIALLGESDEEGNVRMMVANASVYQKEFTLTRLETVTILNRIVALEDAFRTVFAAHSADARNGEGVALTDALADAMYDAGRRYFRRELVVWKQEARAFLSAHTDLLAAPAAPAPIDVTTIPGYVTPAQSAETAAAHAKLGKPMDPCDCSACVKMRGHLYGDAPAPAPAAQADDDTDYKACFTDACLDLAAIHTALGIPDDEAGGAEPILEAIAELQARQQSATPAEPVSGGTVHAANLYERVLQKVIGMGYMNVSVALEDAAKWKRRATPADAASEADKRDAGRYRAVRACGSEWSELSIFDARGHLDAEFLDEAADSLVQRERQQGAGK